MNDKISLSDAVKQIAARRGITQRAAKRLLLKHLKSGEISATGVLVRNKYGQMLTTGQRETIDPEFWDVNKPLKK